MLDRSLPDRSPAGLSLPEMALLVAMAGGVFYFAVASGSYAPIFATIRVMTSENDQNIWVSITEAAEFTGYNRGSVEKVVQRLSKKPEESREIKLRKRTIGWELWLPDLILYLQQPRHKPQRKRKISAS
jgi:hypothetical protein